MRRSAGFAPVASADARILVLDSLPGQTSLRQRQYYAHARNAFWPIMQAVYGIRGDYVERCTGLKDNRVALWDVLQASERPGSLDAAIRVDTALANDFEGFFAAHARLRSVFFNGKKAEQLFRRLVSGQSPVNGRLDSLAFRTLPSTSPAYAAMPFSAKLGAWQAALAEAARP